MGSVQPQRDTELPSVPKSLPINGVYSIWKGHSYLFVSMIPFATHISSPSLAALLWTSLDSSLSCRRSGTLRWDKGKCCRPTSAALHFARSLRLISASVGLCDILAESPKATLLSGHTWLLCYSVRVLCFLDLWIHGNGSMNGPFRTASLHSLPLKP